MEGLGTTSQQFGVCHNKDLSANKRRLCGGVPTDMDGDDHHWIYRPAGRELDYSNPEGGSPFSKQKVVSPFGSKEGLQGLFPSVGTQYNALLQDATQEYCSSR